MPLAFDQRNDTNDDALMKRYAAGDQSAARALTLRHTPLVLNLAHRLLGSREEAEEIAQEVMVKLWRSATDWQQGRARVSTWLYRVTYNACIDRLRKRRPDAETTGIDAPDPNGDAEAILIRGEARTGLMQAIDTLPERQRSALILRHLEELPNPEIAGILGVSVEAVESLLARGRRRLRELLAPEN